MNRPSSTAKNDILVIAGTNRASSLTAIVANYYVSLLKERGVNVDILSLDELSPDFLGTALYENQGKDPLFNALTDKIKQSSKMVFIAPQYNGSFPGVLKTFIDGLPVGSKDKGEVLRHKKCALVGVSSGYQGNILGLSHLKDILSYLGMHVLGAKVYLSSIEEPSWEAFIAHDTYAQRLQEQAEAFIHF